MSPEQHERATELIQELGLPRGAYQEVESDDGYQLKHADGRPRPYVFGYVRFNQNGTYTVYAYRDFWDPDQRFQRQPTGNNFRYTFHPSTDGAMQYALRAVRTSFDRSR